MFDFVTKKELKEQILLFENTEIFSLNSKIKNLETKIAENLQKSDIKHIDEIESRLNGLTIEFKELQKLILDFTPRTKQPTLSARARFLLRK